MPKEWNGIRLGAMIDPLLFIDQIMGGVINEFALVDNHCFFCLEPKTVPVCQHYDHNAMVRTRIGGDPLLLHNPAAFHWAQWRARWPIHRCGPNDPSAAFILVSHSREPNFLNARNVLEFLGNGGGAKR